MEENGLKKEMRFQKRILLGVFLIVDLPIILWIAYTIYNAPGCSGTYDISDLEISSFNVKFTQYEGKKLGKNIKSLLQQVIACNSNEENKDRVVTVEFCEDGEIISQKNPTQYKAEWNLDKINVNKRYDVQFELQDEGLINKVKISEVNVDR